jgi:two-component system, LytTR family, sensor kinase
MPGKKKKVNVNRTVIWILHIGYWLLFLLLLALFYTFLVLVPGFEKITQSHGFNFWVRLITGFAIVPAIIAFYIFYGYLFTRFLAKRKFIRFFLSGVLVSLLAAIIGAAIASLPFFYGPGFLFGDGFSSAFTILLLMSFCAAVNGIIGAIIKGFISWYNDIRLKEELLQKNYEMELNLVKAQVEPHFLFNTLNNIDVMIEHDSQNASAYVKKLSHILRFMLYESKNEKIPLEKELEYIEKYIQLQQLRSSNADYVQYVVSGQANGLLIEPMLFIPFIENAFKHAGSKKLKHAINIQFELSPELIRFSCTNAIQETPAGQNDFGGLGNDLIKRRIALLYPNRHTLMVNRTTGNYCVQLTINTTP